MVQRATAHVRERRDFDDPALHVSLQLVTLDHVEERIVQRSQIRHDLLLQIARQKAERLAGLDRRARENDPRDLLLLERLHGHRHREISLARAGRADAEDHVARLDRAQVRALPGRLRDDRRALRRGQDFRVEQFVQPRVRLRLRHRAQRIKKLVLADRQAALPPAIELLENAARHLYPIRLALDAQPAFARRHFHPELFLERLQQLEVVRVERLQNATALELESFSCAHTQMALPSPR